MGRKKQINVKSPIRIRFKELTKGNKSIYLDTYQDGKRSYEFLKLFLIPETSQAARVANENAMKVAQAIRAQRLLELENGKAGLRTGKEKMPLLDWLRIFQEIRLRTGQSDKRAEQIGTAIKHVEAFLKGKNVSLGQIDAKYCRDFINYLSTAKSRTATINTKSLAKSTAKSYFIVLSSALKEAVRQGIISVNPAYGLSKEDFKPINAESTPIGYLTIEELQAMIDCTYNNQNKLLRRAFLFACFTGFRISDIRTLKWDEIKSIDSTFFLHKRMQKTATYIDVPLPESALYWLPNKGDKGEEDLVFPTAERWTNKKLQESLPITEWCVNTELNRWAQRAGIKKHITFHQSRHTYATMLITKGADLFTVQKLLGHKSIQTTQVYAELVGKKKREAVELLDDVLSK